MKALSVGLPGREKSRVTPFRYAHRSNSLEPSGRKPRRSASFNMTERIAMDRSAATGVARSEPALDILSRDVGNLPSGEPRQDLASMSETARSLT